MTKSPTQKPAHTRFRAEYLLNAELAITGPIVAGVVFSYYFGSSLAQKCLFVSHERGRDAFAKGADDVYFVAFWVVLFTFLRGASMKYVYHPLARLAGVNPQKRKKMAEQAFMFTYCVIFWSLGMNVMYNGPHWRNTAHYWIGYPHELIPLRMKYYYLMQVAFWFQQLYAIHIETQRTDHYAMLVHHFITITLLVSSYFTNFTRIGNAVLCCMDLTDVFLSLAKILRYLKLTTLCDIAFGLFAISWPFTRHIFFGMIIWATMVEPQKYLDMVWDPEHGKFMTPVTQCIYVGLFMMLSVIMLYWFSMIIRVIIDVVKGNKPEDTRSDDESDSDEKVKED